MIVIVLGPPGSGKSTQTKFLSKKLGVPGISMGQVLRNAEDAKTMIGLEASKYVEEGKLVPSRIMEALTKFRLEEKDCEEGFILDGAPRRVEEAVMLDDYLSRKGKHIDHVIFINLGEKTAIERLLKRAKLPKVQGGGRDDDNMEDIKVRFREFKDHLQAVKVYYQQKDLFRVIDGEAPIEEVRDRISAALKV